MVHERPRIVKPSGIDSDDQATPMGEIDSSTVLEIEDPREKQKRESTRS
jgi:hypothetical protein